MHVLSAVCDGKDHKWCVKNWFRLFFSCRLPDNGMKIIQIMFEVQRALTHTHKLHTTHAHTHTTHTTLHTRTHTHTQTHTHTHTHTSVSIMSKETVLSLSCMAHNCAEVGCYHLQTPPSYHLVTSQ